MDGDSGVVSLGEDGLVSKWTRSVSIICSAFDTHTHRSKENNQWKWAKVLDAGNERRQGDQICFAYTRDRIAVSFPQTGVKV